MEFREEDRQKGKKERAQIKKGRGGADKVGKRETVRKRKRG